MPTTELRRARRVLAQLNRRHGICVSVASYWYARAAASKYRNEARRMAREIAREIAAQELECRRLALTGPWRVRSQVYTDPLSSCVHHYPTRLRRYFFGRNAKARAVSYAEKMNRKDNGK